MGEGMPISKSVLEAQTPKIVNGWNLVETETALAFPALIKNLAVNHDKILWIDSSNQAKTHFFESRPELLEKIYIARAFTALQHHQLCKNIEEYDLIVVPEIDKLYEESSLYSNEKDRLFKSMLEELTGKILYSISTEIGFSAVDRADNTIKVEQTDQGLKFSQKDRKTRIYADNTGVQTTVPLYEEVKEERWEEPIKPIETG